MFGTQSYSRPSLLCLLALPLALSCSDDSNSAPPDASSADASSTDASNTDASNTDASNTDASTTDASNSDASTTDASVAACTYNGFDENNAIAERDSDLGILFYTAVAGTLPNQQRLGLDFYFTEGATDGPHSFEFTGQTLAECHTCLFLHRDCTSDNCADGSLYMPLEGTVEITETGLAGSTLRGSLQGVVLQEVVTDGTTTPALWCIDEHSFELVIQ